MWSLGKTHLFLRVLVGTQPVINNSGFAGIKTLLQMKEDEELVIRCLYAYLVSLSPFVEWVSYKSLEVV